MKTIEYHAFYSAKQEQAAGGHTIWATRSGKEVKCTCIAPTKDHGCNYDDMEYLGKVSRFVRSSMPVTIMGGVW